MSVIRPLAATVLAAGALIAADVSDDFERDDPGMTGRGDGQFATVTTVPAPAGIGHGKALRIAWPDPHGRWVDVAYTAMRPVPALAAEATATVTMAVWAEAFAGVSYLAIRFNDAHGETFEWRGDLPTPGQSGWRTLTITIDPAKSAGHWGGVADGHVDFPLSLKGYAVRLGDDKAPAGALLIDDVTIVPAVAK